MSMATGLSSVSGFFCTCSADRATRPRVDGKQHRDFFFTSLLQWYRSLGLVAVLSVASAVFGDDRAVQDHFARLASVGDTLHDVRTGDLVWFLFLPSSARCMS